MAGSTEFGFWRRLAPPTLVLLAACGGSAGESPSPSALVVTTMELAAPSQGYVVRREFAGRVEAARTSAVGFELPGQLAGVEVDEGDAVAAGDALATLDTDRLRAREAEAAAALAAAEATLELADATLARIGEALEFGGVSRQEYDEALRGHRAALAARDAARSQLQTVRVDLEKSVLRAPYDAVVIARSADEGEVLAPGREVLRLQERSRPRVRIGVAGDMLDAISGRDRLSLLVNGRRLPALVRAVLPLRDAATRTVDVLFELEEAAGILPGDLARLELHLPVEGEGYWVPLGSLAEGERGLWTNLVAVPLDGDARPVTGATHRLEPRPVEVLYEEADRVFVRGALAPADRLVTGGLQRVVPGQAVRIAIRQARGDDDTELE